VLLDEEAPGPSHGVDVGEDGEGMLEDGRLHGLIRRRGAVHPATLRVTFRDPGAEVFAFTFG
jgi:hypothetical protein